VALFISLANTAGLVPATFACVLAGALGTRETTVKEAALLLGALMIHGIQPGPRLIAEQPDIFWGLIASFWIGNLILVVLNVPMIGL
jgi:TctA family transporter